MALSERRDYSVSPRDKARSWLEKFHIVSPTPPSAAVIFLETGSAPEGSGIVEDRPIAEFDMSEQPIEGQMYLWHGQSGDLKEVAVFTPRESTKVATEPRAKNFAPVREPIPSRNLLLGLSMAHATTGAGGAKK